MLRFTRRGALALGLAAVLTTQTPVLTPALADDLPVLKVATLQGGTVSWELDTIAHYGLDAANGFHLEVLPLAGKSASEVALLGGEADAIVTDWFWVARQRAEGRDYTFIPYSRAVGGLLVKPQSGIMDLEDLAGKKIGIAGGPLDKSWLILRAYAQQEFGMDLAAQTEQVFGAPPLIMEAALSGEVDAAINFWHFGAKMQARGMESLVTTGEAAQALGLDPETPLLGYVLSEKLVAEKPEAVAGLRAASRAAKDMLATNDEAFARLRDVMRVKSDAQYVALVAGFREGIPAQAPVDEAAADKMLKLMAGLGGEDLLGPVKDLPPGTFLTN
ncbi:NitT/TauT family transport system substrate-binding protein [Rhodobacter aestuarii]|uniref:NitT/TauT family transport system substrate-binding protein n=1 Tax=Rhodobacter aestuarii TaxID=453582 RepID=A0A1N7IWJ9_9RHOB|nr:ABC transporter substrate-binding protein [Rhodobacter aestuarii]PTV97458.1 NitT/TauT family transport system substrate-binding protein [Rhodobacter aestuarii]SIS41450.1 NitT/TauT family transport system substrate-binding protein [Rhodobacter aestuarii]